LPNHKRSVDYILLALISVNLMTNAAGSYVLPFYPPLAFHQAHMDYSIIGMLMSCKSIGALIAAYVFGSKIQVWGRKKWLLITLFAQAVIMLLYATLYYITEYYYLFLGTSIMIRLMEGIMRSI
jgi:MFS family permease